MNGKVGFAVLTIACLMAILLAVTPTWSGNPSPSVYDQLGGLNSSEALEYDSGWLNITDKCGQNITITHNLNSIDLTVEIQGKTALDSGPHQKHYGLTGFTPGWSKTYGGTRFAVAHALVQTGDGGYALAGLQETSAGDTDFWLVKTDVSGTVQWNQTYGGADYDSASGLVQTPDGGYALAGSFGTGPGSWEFWLVKTDANGIMQWNKTYGGPSVDGAKALVLTSDGGYALAGGGFANLVKTDPDGNVQWTASYAGSTNALIQSTDGGYALAGGYNGDFWLVKTDANGIMQWNKTYGGTQDDMAYTLVQTSDGGYALAGYLGIYFASSDFWLVKTDANGNMQWNRTYGEGDNDLPRALVQTSDGGYALAGTTLPYRGTEGYAWLVKTDANGNMQWNNTYFSTVTTSDAMALIMTSDGGYAFAGDFDTPTQFNWEYLLVKTGVESGLAWVDSSVNTVTLYRGATDAWWNFVHITITKRSSESLFLVVRGMDNGIYYRFFNESTSTWDTWEKLPGATPDSPAAAILGNQLRVVVRGMDGSSLWYGTIDLATDTFSGWTLLSGATPSAPELASTGTTPP
jgi:hypothetical protein